MSHAITDLSHIVEHMTGLAQIPDEGFQFYAVSPKVRALGSLPLRCFAQQ